jgi:subtilisin family serine protease
MRPSRCIRELLPRLAAPRRPGRPRPARAWAIGFLFVLLLPAAHPPTGSAQAGGISPELQAVLARAGVNASVPFVVVLREQADPLELRIEADRLRLEGRPDEARARTLETLKGLAARTQSPVTSRLRVAVQRGRARSFAPLWVANAIAGVGTPELVRELSALSEVDRVIWDAPCPVAEQTDEVVPPGGLRSIPPRPLAGGRPSVGWNLQRIGAPTAWNQGLTGAGVIVAVIDTGVDYTHPDLASHIWANADEIPRNGIDDDFNGFVDDTLGWDFVFGDNDPMGEGPSDHGTRSAGLVAGDGTNGIATGVAPQAVIMPIKGSGGPWTNVFSSIQYAIDNGADVISMSLTEKWHFNPKPDFALWRQITDSALAAGVFHANSIGNEGGNLETDPEPFNIAAPGGSPAPWIATEQYVVGGVSSVTGVGAIDSLSYLADFSGRGPVAWEDLVQQWSEYPYAMPLEYRDYPYSDGSRGLIKPDLLAPGKEVLSTQQGGGYLSFTGTSAACPHVAGAMALLLQAHPDLTPAQMAMLLQRGASDLGPRGKDNDYGAGLLYLPRTLALAGALPGYCRIGGTVRDSVTGEPLRAAIVYWLESFSSDSTDAMGRYELAPPAGTVTLLAQRFGYRPDTLTLALAPGDTVDVPIDLVRAPVAPLSGLVLNAETGLPVEGAVVSLVNAPVTPDTTGPDGAYAFDGFPADTPVTVRALRFGYARADSLVNAPADSSAQVDFALAPGYSDDFEVDLGWSIASADDDATWGFWVRTDPTGIVFNGVPVQPELDHTPGSGHYAFVTGNGVPGCGPHQNDVDGGVTTLTSPPFDAAACFAPEVILWYWYSNDAGIYDDDTLRIELSGDAGATWTPVLVRTTSNHAWQELVVDIEDVMTPTAAMRLRVRASDRGRDSSVEVAIDDFWMGTPGWAGIDAAAAPRFAFLPPQPNPAAGPSLLRYTLAHPGPVELAIFDVTGRCVRRLQRELAPAGAQALRWDGADDGGRRVPAGTYFARLRADGAQAARRIVRIR